MLYLLWGFISFFTFMLLVTPFMLFSYFIFKGKQATDIVSNFIKIWAGGFSILMAYRFKVINRHFVKKNKAYIFVVNHSSYLDAIAVVKVIPQSFKPLGKIEMVNIPIFGMLYKRLVILIDRSSKESRERCVIALKEEIARGQSILIFPEGTMNRTEHLLGDFYDGAFKIAIETQTPILPLTIINTKELMPRNDALAIKNGVIKCVFSEEIDVRGLKKEDLLYLKNRVYKEMESQLLAYKTQQETNFIIG
jgi:1-acyl-sn-glycerol-3-phosphate acyltransferase